MSVCQKCQHTCGEFDKCPCCRKAVAVTVTVTQQPRTVSADADAARRWHGRPLTEPG